MSTAGTTDLPSTPDAGEGRSSTHLFLISVLILFLELACIRWFPAHIPLLTFFTNIVLLACFLGMSLGCLAASHKRNYLVWTPFLLLASLFLGFAVHRAHWKLGRFLDAGEVDAPQLFFFGREHFVASTDQVIALPIELAGGAFFVLLALTMVGPGQELGRALDRVPNRIRAYTVNIVGSLVGIVLFTACSWAQLPPVYWFVPLALTLGYLLLIRPPRHERRHALLTSVTLVLVVIVSSLSSWALSGEHEPVNEAYWSPYYRVGYTFNPSRSIPYTQRRAPSIDVNMQGHQSMISREEVYPAYSLPYLLNQDAGRKPFEDVLIIGAGSGNDVSRAVQWTVGHIDAVEIDPVILALGKRDHPDRPYQDERVAPNLDDGRNFLRSTDRKYDLIIYALVDSLALHSNYSNVPLESYLFTQQAFADVRRHLKPGGMFVVYNYFRHGWLLARMKQTLRETFPDAPEPLILTLPYRETVGPEEEDGFSFILVGETKHIADAFQNNPVYWLRQDQAPKPQGTNGFTMPTDAEREKHAWFQLGLTEVIPPAERLPAATDDWPFPYVRQPMIPLRPSLSGMAMMGALALVLILAFLPRPQNGSTLAAFDGRMFFLGAGFMLLETKAVVQMVLLFGSTWMVNTVVFFAVLVMILLANLYVAMVKPERLGVYYVGLLAALVLNFVVPLDYFLGMNRVAQVSGACLLVFTPILFAGVIFAVSFTRTRDAGLAFGANIAGAIAGGLAEYASMLIGFSGLMVAALAFYALSGVFRPRATAADVKSTGECQAEPQAAVN